MELIYTIVGACIGFFGSVFSAKYTYETKINDKKMRLRNQLSYLVDILERNIHSNEEIKKGQKNINSLILTSDIFILDINYKDDLLFIELPDIDKQIILFWLKQWEIIDKKLSERTYDSIAGSAAFNGKCRKEYENIMKILPDIKEIIKNKLESD